MLLEPLSFVSAQTVLWTYTYGVKGGREFVDTPTVDPPATIAPPSPHRAVAHHLTVNRPPPSPSAPGAFPTPIVATFEQPIAKNMQLHTKFNNFFQSFLKIFVIL